MYFVVVEVTLVMGKCYERKERGNAATSLSSLASPTTLPWLSLIHCLQSCATPVLPSSWRGSPSCAPEEQGKARGEVAALLWSLGHVRSRWEAEWREKTFQFSLSYITVWKGLFQLLWWNSAQVQGLYHSNLILPKLNLTVNVLSYDICMR